MKKSTIDIFGEVGLKNAVETLGWKIKNNYFFDNKNRSITCSVCHSTKISKKNLVMFYPKRKGKHKLGVCCDNPNCFFMASTEARYFEISSLSSNRLKPVVPSIQRL